MQRGFKKRAEEISLELRKELDVEKNDFLDPYKLAAHLEVRIVNPYDLDIPQAALDVLLNSPYSDEWSGLGSIQNGISKIYLNTSHVQNRLYSTICHELAHFILEHKPMAVVDYLMPRTCYNEEQEKEADYLGACLQIPEQALFYLCTFKNFTIEKLARRFRCSEKMARRRYNETGTKYKVERYRKKRGW